MSKRFAGVPGELAMVTQKTTETTKPIPCIRELPFLGSMFAYQKKRLALFSRIARECGDVGCFHFGSFRLIQLNTPELVHRVLVEQTDDFDKGKFIRNAFEDVIGKGLFTSQGEVLPNVSVSRVTLCCTRGSAGLRS